MEAKKTRREHRLNDSPEMIRVRKAFGLAVRARRTELGLTLAQLAAKSGLTYHTIWNVERCQNWGSLPVCLVLCRTLGMGMPELDPVQNFNQNKK